MAGLLEETVRRWASTPCGPQPCGLEVWRYCCELAGIEPTDLPWHQSKIAAGRLLRAKGGLAAYAGSLVENIGWRCLAATESPIRGDVGVIDIPGMGHTCALFLAPRWAVKGDRSVLIVNGDLIAAWRLPECHKPLPFSSSENSR